MPAYAAPVPLHRSPPWRRLFAALDLQRIAISRKRDEDVRLDAVSVSEAAHAVSVVGVQLNLENSFAHVSPARLAPGGLDYGR